MTKYNLNEEKLIIMVLEFLLMTILAFIFSILVLSQTNQTSQNKTSSTENSTIQNEKKISFNHIFTNYKGILIGLTAKEVIAKPGSVNLEDSNGFY